MQGHPAGEPRAKSDSQELPSTCQTPGPQSQGSLSHRLPSHPAISSSPRMDLPSATVVSAVQSTSRTGEPACPKNPWWEADRVWGIMALKASFKSLPNLQPLSCPTPYVPCSCLQVPPLESPLPEKEEQQRPCDQNHRNVREVPLAGVRGLRVRPLLGPQEPQVTPLQQEELKLDSRKQLGASRLRREANLILN